MILLVQPSSVSLIRIDNTYTDLQIECIQVAKMAASSAWWRTIGLPANRVEENMHTLSENSVYFSFNSLARCFLWRIWDVRLHGPYF
jgi:hypothetical protein